MSYIRILFRCEDYFTGKIIWDQFPRFADLQSEISLFLNLLHDHLLASQGSRNSAHEAGPGVARQRLFEMDIMKNTDLAWILYRCETHSDLGTDRAARSIWSDSHFHILLPFDSWMNFASSKKKNGRDNTSIKACGKPVRFEFPNLLLKGLMNVVSHWFLYRCETFLSLGRVRPAW